MGTQEGFADAVIVAAGSSRRMDGVDKLAADLNGRPVLQWSVDVMAANPSVRRTIVVAAPERVAAVSAMPWVNRAAAQVVPGGARRQDSVAAGVRASDAEVVLVHDGARPLVSAGLISAVAEAALTEGAAIPVLPVADSLRHVDGDGRIGDSVSREGLFAAQTPQAARRELLLQAIEQHGATREFTDEAELLRIAGAQVVTVPGDPWNLKITHAEDMDIARLLVGASPFRTGSGEDVHPFSPEMGLRLGGIGIPDAPRLHGHSDGDVALHAICDALLGAAGLPDIGRVFPAGDPATRGVDSADLLRRVVALAAERGSHAWSIDLTILGARPKLGGKRLDAMRDRIAELVNVTPERVSVKASTGNLSGDEGAGRVIRATAAVTTRSSRT